MRRRGTRTPEYAGWDVIRTLAPGHVDAVREAVFEPLSPGQPRRFGAALTAIIDRLDHSVRLRDPREG